MLSFKEYYKLINEAVIYNEDQIKSKELKKLMLKIDPDLEPIMD